MRRFALAAVLAIAPLAAQAGPAETYADADRAFKAGQWKHALELAEHALADHPDASTAVRAHTTAALAACQLRDRAHARPHYATLVDPRKKQVARRCKQLGVRL